MEPSNLNSASSESNDDARLESWLRQSATDLPDDGFSQRVLAALPPPRTTSDAPSHFRFRESIIAVGALAGVALAGWRIGVGASGADGNGAALASRLHDNIAEISHAFSQTTAASLDPALSLAATVTLCSLAFVFRRNLGWR